MLPFDIADKPCECGHNMRANGFDIPYEMHIFPRGGHGLCLATEEPARGDKNAILPEVAEWMPLSITWIRGF